jgi:uncharacterized membrane protein YfcA
MAWLLSSLAGLVAGFLSGVFGIGGGVVLVPMLALVLGLGQHDAQGMTLAILLLPVGLAAVIEYHRAGHVRWRLVAPLVAGFLAGVWIGSEAATAVAERPLRLGFVAFLVAIAIRNWRAGGTAPAAGGVAAAGVGTSRWVVVHALWIGAAGGASSGLLGIGGAVLMIPLLVAVVGLTQHEAQGTSLAVMLPPVGLPGVLVYSSARGGLPWLVVGCVAAGFLLGGALGARLVRRVAGPALVRGFALFQLTVAAGLLWRALG